MRNQALRGNANESPQAGSPGVLAFGWWAIVPDTYDGDLERIAGQRLSAGMAFTNERPRGAIIRYRESYGSPDQSNKGLRLTAEEAHRRNYMVFRNTWAAGLSLPPHPRRPHSKPC